MCSSGEMGHWPLHSDMNGSVFITLLLCWSLCSQHGQDTVEELRSKDYKHSLERKEKEARDQRQRERTGRAFTGMWRYRRCVSPHRACALLSSWWSGWFTGCVRNSADSVTGASLVFGGALLPGGNNSSHYKWSTCVRFRIKEVDH